MLVPADDDGPACMQLAFTEAYEAGSLPVAFNSPQTEIQLRNEARQFGERQPVLVVRPRVVPYGSLVTFVVIGQREGVSNLVEQSKRYRNAMQCAAAIPVP
ncbi:hypothetical protein LMG28138_04861 [Pararobbsia alpina]|uniref:Uncharacterized protein n=1 Tax=Pararobbsia alpina TaxID=621374 RepID=A0A6S7BHJ8_9BURK|nr:hypothetical protein LMG28138_04861 [Pararobbsia alpina]